MGLRFKVRSGLTRQTEQERVCQAVGPAGAEATRRRAAEHSKGVGLGAGRGRCQPVWT